MQILDCRFKILKISLTYLEVKFKMKSSYDLSKQCLKEGDKNARH